jgi:hypothetical protein
MKRFDSPVLPIEALIVQNLQCHALRRFFQTQTTSVVRQPTVFEKFVAEISAANDDYRAAVYPNWMQFSTVAKSPSKVWPASTAIIATVPRFAPLYALK